MKASFVALHSESRNLSQSTKIEDIFRSRNEDTIAHYHYTSKNEVQCYCWRGDLDRRETDMISFLA